ncbi:MAG: aminotransferase class IV [Planctomycetes bacterium]|nr:aminotransferase class IV family protein [Planctomycetota bacterium]MCB9884474.1 aminotransferase class IV [Planctomycetota bacterium]
MSNLCNLDGAILPEQEATVPVLDRSFLFGDSIYEVVRTIDGVPFAWAEHWRRLELSADSLAMPLDLDERTVARRVADTLAAVDHGESYVRIIVSRGTGLAPNIDVDNAPGPQRWVLLVRPITQTFGKPARLALVPRRRNDRRALDPASKSGNYLNNVLGLAEAKAAGATDCVMLNSDGFVTEASTSNLFARLDGTWCTPPLEAGILAGITRGLLLQFLPQVGERVAERDLRAEDLLRAEELFLSSTLRDIGPVTHLDGRALCDGDNGGPHTRRIAPLFAAHIRERMRTVDAPRWRELTT